MNVARLQFDELPNSVLSVLNSHSLCSTRDFLSLWQAAGGRPVCWLVDKSGDFKAALPGVEFGRWPLARFQAGPDGLFAQFVSRSRPISSDTAGRIVEAVLNHGYAKVFVSDFQRILDAPVSLRSVVSTTAIVDISSEDWLPPDKKLQSELRKAEREGAIVRSLEPKRDLDGFLQLTAEVEMQSGRSSRYDQSFYESLGRLTTGDNRIVWNVVEWEGRIIAAQIFLVDRDTALYWQSFVDRDYSHTKATQYLLWSSAHRMRTFGVKRLNLGLSPHGADGLYRFKEKWGGEEYTYPVYMAASRLGRMF